ncbi:hypothetical protein BC938DRAFT_472441 [Jimgerdemannia flammicorona]|uniref:WW domain-containing protein n=1 Tax=Jimgerdemannia flammicorona TaxID=994334 RepID=A0A433Q634_9FUNG|nr:hypothetical protein BC938DRAFT_472441 [Jimgerdemannia flammicorona]
MSIPLPLGWEAKQAPDGRWYFIDHQRQTTTWEDPRQKIPNVVSPSSAEPKVTTYDFERPMFFSHNTPRPTVVSYTTPTIATPPFTPPFTSPAASPVTSPIRPILAQPYTTPVNTYPTHMPNFGPLPPGWDMRTDTNGRPYFLNHKTETSTWEDPRLKATPPQGVPTTAGLDALPPGWEKRINVDGRPYFVNHITKLTSWQDPRLNSPPIPDTPTSHLPARRAQTAPIPPTPLPSVLTPPLPVQRTQTTPLPHKPIPTLPARTQSDPVLNKGVKSDPLPPGWEEAKTPKGVIYFIDHSTQTTTWDDPRLTSRPPPSSSKGGASKPLPAGWEEKQTENGVTYFIDHNTQTTTWEDPRLHYKRVPSTPVRSTSVREPESLPEQIEYYALPLRNKNGHIRYYISTTPNLALTEDTETSLTIYTITLNKPYQKTTQNITYQQNSSTTISVIGNNISTTNTFGNQSITTILRPAVKRRPGGAAASVVEKVQIARLRVGTNNILCCRCRIPKRDECPCIHCKRHPSDGHTGYVEYHRAGDGDGPHSHGEYCHSDELRHEIRPDFFHLRQTFDSELVLGLLAVWAEGTSLTDRIWRTFLDSWTHAKYEFGTVYHRSQYGLSFFQPNLSLLQRFENYVLDCYQRDKHVNIVPLWHGTTNVCTGGTCMDFGTCANCNIMTQGFSNEKAGRRSWERYGPGIYFASNSSKAHTYVNVDEDRRPQPNSNGKYTIIMSLVVLGRLYETHENDMSYLVGPPDGYDSLRGMVKPEAERLSNKDLRYEEYVVYSSDAVLPIATLEYEVYW